MRVSSWPQLYPISSLWRSRARIHLHSFPTRRSSDLTRGVSWTWVNDRYRDSLPADFQSGLMTLDATDRLHVKQGRSTARRSEEHTSELQSQFHLVCRLLLEKKKLQSSQHTTANSRDH